ALIGILNLETGRQALLRLPNGRYERLAVGDTIEGWKVRGIDTDAMRLVRGAEERTLPLIGR
ncbi:MAG: amidophosphoribosyltransferase, partial [Thermohalobaculum sp.]|nr:amidophosphoribosyltransferase [Thermohalobaculum sp.]